MQDLRQAAQQYEEHLQRVELLRISKELSNPLMRAQTWVNEINRGRHPFIGDPESRPSSARLERMGKGEGVISIRFDKWADSEETALGMYDVAKYRLGGDTRLGIRLTRHTEGRPLVIDVIMRN